MTLQLLFSLVAVTLTWIAADAIHKRPGIPLRLVAIVALVHLIAAIAFRKGLEYSSEFLLYSIHVALAFFMAGTAIGAIGQRRRS